MILAIDIHYKETYAKAVAVAFYWEDETPQKVYIDTIKNVAPYIPGEFYIRELPCILKILSQVDLKTIDAIIVDGHVYVSNNHKYGLGGHLWEALDKKIPIIGVAKKSFINTEKVTTPWVRGTSKIPLYISCVGIDKETVLQNMELLHGKYRMPTILKLLDTVTKTDI